MTRPIERDPASPMTTTGSTDIARLYGRSQLTETDVAKEDSSRPDARPRNEQ